MIYCLEGARIGIQYETSFAGILNYKWQINQNIARKLPEVSLPPGVSLKESYVFLSLYFFVEEDIVTIPLPV